MRFEVLVDRGERATKCTILPLAGHQDLAIVRYQRGKPLAPLAGDLLLHPDGVPLDQWRGAGVTTLSAIDCTWKRLHTVLAFVEKPLPTLVRIPDGFVTAYPRRNKLDRDPSAGLATIEAVFIAAAMLGHWDVSLLAKYAFAGTFLNHNRVAFERHLQPSCAGRFAAELLAFCH